MLRVFATRKFVYAGEKINSLYNVICASCRYSITNTNCTVIGTTKNKSQSKVSSFHYKKKAYMDSACKENIWFGKNKEKELNYKRR